MASNLVTTKAGSVIAENLKVTLATPVSLFPSQLVAMVGIAQNTALQIAPIVTDTISQMQAQASTWISGNINLALANSLQVAAASLSSLGTQLLPPANHAAFGSILAQAQSHIADSLEIRKSMNFLANTDFSEFGTGITNMADLTVQGINNVVGSLPAAAEAFKAAGPMFDMGDIGSFGLGSGLVSNLQSNKLANFSGVNEALVKAGVDLNNLSDPIYADQIDRALTTITDPKVISTITSHFEATPFKQILNLKDLTDITKLANPASISGFTGTLTSMADKFNDIGTNFADLSAAEGLLNNLEVPDVAALNAAFPSMSSLVSGLSGAIDSITGTGTGPLGLPSMENFTEAVSGGPSINSMFAALSTGANVAISNAVTEINNMIATSQSLLGTAGTTFDVATLSGLGASTNFAASLHGFGADRIGSGVSGILTNMVTSNAYGDAIKASLIEGKNKALMAAAGIRELNFNGAENANPFAGLPSSGEASQGATFLTGDGG